MLLLLWAVALMRPCSRVPSRLDHKFTTNLCLRSAGRATRTTVSGALAARSFLPARSHGLPMSCETPLLLERLVLDRRRASRLWSSVSGSVLHLKQPVPGLRHRWNVNTVHSSELDIITASDGDCPTREAGITPVHGHNQRTITQLSRGA